MVRMITRRADKQATFNIDISFILIVMLIVGAASGYVYGGARGAAAGAVLAVLLYLLAFIGAVPFIGAVLYIYIAGVLRNGILAHYVEIAGTATCTLLYYIALIPAIMITIITTIFAARIVLETIEQ